MLKPIPFTKGFYADDKNGIFDSDKVLRNQYVNGCGYKTCSVLTLDGRWVTFGVQRLVALAFKPPTTNHLLLTVNHKDSNKENNHPQNLEWVSSKLNIVHDVLLNRYTNRPLVSLIDGDDVSYFNDIYDVSIHLDEDVDTIWELIKNNQPINGKIISHIKASSSIASAIKFKRPVTVVSKKRPLVMFDITTKQITEFESISSLAKKFKVPTSRVHQRVSTPNFPKVFRKNFIIIDKGEDQTIFDKPIPETSVNNFPKEIICYNLTSKKFTRYKSTYVFLKTHPELSKKAVTTRVKNNSLNPTNNWIVKLVTDVEKDKQIILQMARSV